MSDRWKTDDIGNLEGKVVVVTGGNSGLGYEAVKIYAEKGATVVMAVRSENRGQEARDKIMKSNPKGIIKVMTLELASLKSIESFSKSFKGQYERLDILLNNAGIMFVPYGKTEDGFERQMGINHLGHFALTAQLFELLKGTDSSRIVNISSIGHRAGVMDFDNLLFENGKDYSEMAAYGRSKLANLLFTYELQRRVEKAGLNMKVLAAHPGGSRTNLARHVAENWWFRLLYPLLILLMQSAYRGSLPGVRASLDAEAKGGTYYGPNGFMEQMGRPVVVQSNEASHSLAHAKRLWEASEKLTGVTFKVG